MKKLLRILLVLVLCIVGFIAYQYRSLFFQSTSSRTSTTTAAITDKIAHQKLINHAHQLKQYAVQHHFSNTTCLLVDMSLPSGKNRFFVYDLEKDSIKYAGLVAHGSGKKSFTSNPIFSNAVNSGCTSIGKYKVGYKYAGRFGEAFKLNGLDTSNSNAYNRNVVLHAYGCIPDNEPYPLPICNSLGCAMVSYHFLEKLDKEISKSPKTILMWVYN